VRIGEALCGKLGCQAESSQPRPGKRRPKPKELVHCHRNSLAAKPKRLREVATLVPLAFGFPTPFVLLPAALEVAKQQPR
jgi:hypothetical protein